MGQPAKKQQEHLPAEKPAPPPVMPISVALANIREQFPKEAALLEAVTKNNVVALATDEAFLLRDTDGIVRAYKQNLTLSLANKGLVSIQGDIVISAQGYEMWQEAAGATVIFPSEVLVDGEWKQNPAVIRDKKTDRIIMIYARAVAFRFSNKGIPMVSDWTTIYDTPSYRLIDLLAKAKKHPQAFKLLPVEMQPEADGTWAQYKFDESAVLWLNTSHDETLDWFSTIMNREKKCIDLAQTFAKRNALKHLSALQKAPGPFWIVPVICWRPVSGNIIKWDATQYANLQDRVGKMVSGDKSEFKKIEFISGSERASEDDASGVIEAGDVTEDDQAASIDVQQNGAAASEISEADAQVINNLKVARTEFLEEYNAACQKLEVEPDADHDALTAGKIMAEINSILDSK